jgi:hypothetical protein
LISCRRRSGRTELEQNLNKEKGIYEEKFGDVFWAFALGRGSGIFGSLRVHFNFARRR